MRYLPLTENEKQSILKLCGKSNFEELTQQIPVSLRLKENLKVEASLSEPELMALMRALGKKNTGAHMQSHLGQGIYQHSWPTVIDQLTNRGEFLTAYTPYQPEISQGTLQVIFEFQSLIANLMGMQVSNASLYDGSTALVEGILMAARLKNAKNGVVYVSEGTYSRTFEVIKSYLLPLGFKIKIWNAQQQSCCSDTQSLGTTAASEQPVAVVMQSPNKWGLVEDWEQLSKAGAATGSKTIAHVAHPLSLALFSAPGEHNVDIVTGEGQALGNAAGFGGPLLGLLCCKKQDVRQLPGRLVGLTSDAKGQQAFCITLATREQHIRRERATSNICSNQNLIATRSCMYMTLMGPQGMKEVARQSRNNALYARKLISQQLGKSSLGIRVLEGECFNEICVLFPKGKENYLNEVLKRGESSEILAGLQIEAPEANAGLGTALAIAFTEAHSKDAIEKLCNLFGDFK